ncbi:MAG: hypothetical protein CBC28_02670 [Flavobacteriaceae bacterium TMED68]|nr:MAG: hypothetical protein CBC28_02670 [Flavobacteriaceae bacterium TMED68]
MILRIQTFYLSLAFFLSILIYTYSFDTLHNTIIGKSHFFLVSAIILVFTILLYKKRSFQSFICLSLLILNLFVLILIAYNFINKLYLNLVHILPILILIKQSLIFFARKSIIKDENLIRSIDRLR